ncbi:DNA gyrase subunit B [Campylobacter mucosalis]|uniref:DNA gyrase subunit B n=1 Tax=Campylobacter mucosalis TaxID=202 RepID=UPI001C3D0F29|nr:DNA gyrase subunit B [Campylobacter mucosalis]
MIVKILLVVFGIFYPFTIVFFADFTPITVLILAFLWGLKFYFSKEKFELFVAVFFILIFALDGLKFAYPIIISMFMFAVFYASLKDVPIITKFALLKEPNLDEKGRIYTRKLTKIWICFFAINAIVCLILAFLNDKAWAFYSGFLSYVLIGILFFGEIVYRRFVLKV